MRKKLLRGKMMAVLAVLLALFTAVGVAEDEFYGYFDALEQVLQNASTDASGQWKYVVNTDGETATIVLYIPIPTSVDLPREIDGFRVTAIGDYAFESTVLEKITLPDSLISIGRSAFQWCFSLTEITLPDSLISIGDYAFLETSLSQVTLPDSLVSIGIRAFYDCYYLTEITLPQSLTSIGSGALGSCRNLSRIEVLPGNQSFSSLDGVLFDVNASTLLVYPAKKADSVYTVPDGVAAIGEYSFADCYALMQVILPGLADLHRRGRVFRLQRTHLDRNGGQLRRAVREGQRNTICIR